MKITDSGREYYDTQYHKQEKENPAYQIYDQLRAQYISQMARSCSGPALIVGSGSKRDYSILSSIEPVFAFDLSFEALRKVKAGNNLFVADALDIPVPRETFALVVCSEVLEHIPDIRVAVGELQRVLQSDGTLIVSSPNWHSWFGLVRWVSRKLLGRDITSSGQLYDDWKTYSRYKDELSPEFEVVYARGVWYLPPLHYRHEGLPAWLTKIIYLVYSPIEAILSRFTPKIGHLIILKCKPAIISR